MFVSHFAGFLFALTSSYFLLSLCHDDQDDANDADDDYHGDSMVELRPRLEPKDARVNKQTVAVVFFFNEIDPFRRVVFLSTHKQPSSRPKGFLDGPV